MHTDIARPRNTLTALGLRGADACVYETVLTFPGSSPADIAALAGLSDKTTRRATARLTELRLVTINAVGHVHPVAPELAIARLTAERQHDIEHARLVLNDLAAGSYVPPCGRTVDLVEGRDSVRETLEQLTAVARSHLQVVHTYRDKCLPPAPPTLAVHRLVSRSAAETEDLVTEVAQAIARGETVAIIDEPPCGIHIADAERAALVAPDEASVVLLNHRRLVRLVQITFDALARTSAELRPTKDTAGLSAVDRQLVQLLATGLKDAAIARHMGISLRTVVRRINRLRTRLDAHSRFQAGAAARSRGWI